MALLHSHMMHLQLIDAPSVAKGDAKKPKKPATHPPANEMVLAALKNLKERKGSSLQAVKKYIGANYKCDVAKLSIFIRKALKAGVEKGTFVQTKGSGASGSFKLKDKKAAAEKKPKKAAGEKKKAAKKPAAKKATGEKKVKKPAAKKPAGEKKAKAAGAKAAKKAGTVKKAAAPKQKATKPSKAAAKKPKTPKPKKAAPAKKAAPKKAAAKSKK
ncbi:late histone H1-like [Aedes albopictus]|uniref:H15 domain-containing protein n=1 Tax=Aedes albopictus TaxID=7160 RepID=A0ABM1ZQP0_AEDAL